MEQKTDREKPTTTVLFKGGIEISMPELDREAELNMERFAEFMARMIRKYGNQIVA